MTYQNMFDRLTKRFLDAKRDYTQINNKENPLVKGTSYIPYINEHAAARKKWQLASNDYYNFLALINGRHFNVNDDFQF